MNSSSLRLLGIAPYTASPPERDKTLTQKHIEELCMAFAESNYLMNWEDHWIRKHFKNSIEGYMEIADAPTIRGFEQWKAALRSVRAKNANWNWKALAYEVNVHDDGHFATALGRHEVEGLPPNTVKEVVGMIYLRKEGNRWMIYKQVGGMWGMIVPDGLPNYEMTAGVVRTFPRRLDYT